MSEVWRDIPGYEGRYQVSNTGLVKSLPFRQRYLLRNGLEAYRTTKERLLAQQLINSGYLIVHLHLDGAREAFLVHALVARAFCPSTAEANEVNHKDGVKTNNTAENLEWVTSQGNKNHAVAAGLNNQAVAVVSPLGVTYPSIANAAKRYRISPKTIRASLRGEGRQAGRWSLA